MIFLKIFGSPFGVRRYPKGTKVAWTQRALSLALRCACDRNEWGHSRDAANKRSLFELGIQNIYLLSIVSSNSLVTSYQIRQRASPECVPSFVLSAPMKPEVSEVPLELWKPRSSCPPRTSLIVGKEGFDFFPPTPWMISRWFKIPSDVDKKRVLFSPQFCSSEIFKIRLTSR